MTDEAAFLRAIIERPDDDVPRLVFCDWLDEHGQSDIAFHLRQPGKYTLSPQENALAPWLLGWMTMGQWVTLGPVSERPDCDVCGDNRTRFVVDGWWHCSRCGSRKLAEKQGIFA